MSTVSSYLIIHLYMCTYVHCYIGSVPCVEYALKTFSHRVRAESEFNTLVGVVSAAVDEARRQHHQQPGIKVSMFIYTLSYYLALMRALISFTFLSRKCGLIISNHTVSSSNMLQVDSSISSL